MAAEQEAYPANLEIDYPEALDKVTTFLRIIWIIPALIILSLVSGPDRASFMHGHGKDATSHGGDIALGLSAATALLILFRQRYPRWWFNFALELSRFSARVGAYLFLLTDKYPSTVEEQSVHLNIAYPNAQRDLNRWLPLVKWIMVIPHLIILAILIVATLVTTVVAWFAILFTGQYPRGLFDFAVGVGRWALRVDAYAFLLTTDKYPPFSLK
jgi:hypothetical protein